MAPKVPTIRLATAILISNVVSDMLLCNVCYVVVIPASVQIDHDKCKLTELSLSILVDKKTCVEITFSIQFHCNVKLFMTTFF